MNHSLSLASELPMLRRYARALTGSQASGDAFVGATLQALVDDAAVLRDDMSPKIALYHAFHSIWTSAYMDGDATARRTNASPSDDAGVLELKAQERLHLLTPKSRQALLLTAIEGFSMSETAQIMGMPEAAAYSLVEEARALIQQQTRARVLIIEDETLIAMDLADIIERLGHQVVGTANTAKKSIEMAEIHHPDLVLADIQLADGSSGITAVNAILASAAVPVIFITAFPDRLLTGERPEPTFLITKPYNEETVEAAVSQALFFEASSS